MLTQKQKYSKNDVITVMTSLGQEIIGRFKSEENGYLTISNPRTLIQTEKGAAFSICVVMAGTNSDIEINQSAIAYRYNPDPDLVHDYESSVSGLLLPKKQQGIIT